MEVLIVIGTVLGGIVLLSLGVIAVALLLAVIGPPDNLDYDFDDDEI
jgi:hypothetical protein